MRSLFKTLKALMIRPYEALYNALSYKYGLIIRPYIDPHNIRPYRLNEA